MQKSRSSGNKLSPSELNARFQQAVNLHQQGFLAQAEALYQEILQARPNHFDALHLLGVLNVQSRRAAAGAALIRQSIAVNGFQAAPHSNLGNALLELNQHEEAVRSFNKAISLKPDYAEAYCNRGNALNALGRPREALASYDKALALRPDLAEANANRGNALRSLQRYEEALESYDRALACRPAYAEAHMNRGTTLIDLDRHPEALTAYDTALSINPSYALAYTHKGNALKELGRFDEAVRCHQQAISLEPSLDSAYGNLGATYQEMGLDTQAVATYRQALAQRPDNLQVHSNLLFSLSYCQGVSPDDYLAEARAYGAKAAARATPLAHTPKPRVPEQPLRVGLVSGDLRTHPVAFFLESVLNALDAARIELLAYATEPQEDALTQRIKPLFSQWRMIAGMSDAAVAQLINEDQVDILLDLAGHTAGNRLPLFAWKPAPVQASWLGYFASTGVPGIDYLLADEVSLPPQHESHFTETIYRLPDTRLCLTPPAPADELPVADPPALEKGHITFGCFQSIGKISPAVLDAWSSILAANPRAQLLIQNKQLACEAIRERLMQRLSAAGIDPQRATLRKASHRMAYLASYADVDALLDTFPYPGGTTTCEALWMGVPTVTLCGATLLARQGASLLHGAGLPDWVAHTVEDYVAKALAHTSDVDGLADLRRGLRDKVLASPIFDAPLFAKRLETALADLWTARQAP